MLLKLEHSVDTVKTAHWHVGNQNQYCIQGLFESSTVVIAAASPFKHASV